MKRSQILSLIAAVAVAMAVSTEARAEKDALQCVKIKDANKVLGTTVDLQAYTASTGCVVKGAALACLPVEVSASDDVRGGVIPATGYVCFKAKCPNESAPVVSSTPGTRFGTVDMSGDFVKGTKQLCVPYAF